ncbi:MAG: hypothetical protein MJ252_25600 [archaeon]|nr:hypothetical protein [archaeon]
MNTQMNTQILLIFILFTQLNPLNAIQIATRRSPPETKSESELDQFYPHVAKFIISKNGTEKEYSFVFNTISEFTWLVDNNTEAVEEVDVLLNEKWKGKFDYQNITQIAQHLNFTNVQIFNMPSRDIVNYDAGLGLPRKYEREEKEIIGEEGGEKEDVLYNYFYSSLNLTKGEIIISFIHDKNFGKIYFGEYDKNFFDLDIKNTKCNCISRPNKNYNMTKDPSDFWNCPLSNFSITLDHTITQDKSLALFALSGEYIYAPKEYSDAFMNDITGYFQRKNTCQKKTEENGFYYYICEKSNKLKGLELSFGFSDGLNLTVTGDYLFKKYDEKYVKLKVIFANIDYWVLGEPIIRQYNLLFIKNSTEDEGSIIVSRAKEYGVTLLIVAVGCGVFFLLVFIIFFIKYKIQEGSRKNILSADNFISRDIKENKSGKGIKDD